MKIIRNLLVRLEHLDNTVKIERPCLMISLFFEVGAYPFWQWLWEPKFNHMIHKPPEAKNQMYHIKTWKHKRYMTYDNLCNSIMQTSFDAKTTVSQWV